MGRYNYEFLVVTVVLLTMLVISMTVIEPARADFLAFISKGMAAR